MSRREAPLRRRLMWAFALFSLFTAGLFGLYALTFMYAVEDSLLEATLSREAAAMQRHHAATGAWGEPHERYITLHASADDFPDDLRTLHRQEPWRREFPGQAGRHYHVLALAGADGAPAAWLVAEVSQRLVVRPMRGEVLGLLSATALLLLALSLAVAAWLARRIALPLARLAASVDSLDPGDPPRHLGDGYRNDEVGLLARRLEQLAERLRDFVGREREFTRDVSHELRTPLTVIRSASERLLTHPGLDAAARDSVQHLHVSSLQLQQSIDLLLALAREPDAAIAAPAEPVRVLPVLERVIVDQSPLAGGRELQFDITVPERLAAHLPEVVLRTLLSNLVGNAMAHGADGVISIGSDGQRLLIANPLPPGDDAGNGPFERRRDASPGLGLGLGIVQRLCERHGITLEVDRPPGRVVVAFSLSGAGCRP